MVENVTAVTRGVNTRLKISLKYAGQRRFWRSRPPRATPSRTARAGGVMYGHTRCGVQLRSGAMAQLVAHLTGSEGVRGSSPLSSTVTKHRPTWQACRGRAVFSSHLTLGIAATNSSRCRRSREGSDPGRELFLPDRGVRRIVLAANPGDVAVRSYKPPPHSACSTTPGSRHSRCESWPRRSELKWATLYGRFPAKRTLLTALAEAMLDGCRDATRGVAQRVNEYEP